MAEWKDSQRMDLILAEHRPEPLPQGVMRVGHAIERAEAVCGQRIVH